MGTGATRAPGDEALELARRLVDAASRIVVLTGAGISTDSGIPDFRGPQGLWTKNPDAEKMATLSNYMNDPEVRVRAWRSRIEWSGREPSPNRGHEALVELERRGKLHTLITQNIDGLHQQAGTDPSLVVEIHGTMTEIMCMTCGDRRPMQHAIERVQAGEEDPDCRLCGGILKSATISFGQNLVAEDLERSEAAAAACDLLLAVGSSLSVYPIAAIVPLAVQSGARLVIVNAQPTQFDGLADVVLHSSLSEILPALVA